MDFSEWYGREHPRLVSALAVAAGDVSMAADVVDEAFVRAYERWDRVGTMASPIGWTYRTAINVLRRRQRRRAFEQRVRLLGSIASDPGAAPPDWSPEVWDAVARLPPREREAVALRYVADLTTAGIAEAMGIAEGTVGSTLHAARRRLAADLGDGAPLDATEPAAFEEPSDA